MKRLFFLIGIFAFIFSLNFVSSWGPNVHVTIEKKALAEENSTLITKIINDNYDACLSGLVYADVGIFDYYTNFKSYKGLHSYSLVEEMLRIATTDRQRAFAYCWKLHLGADGISHNFFVPDAIRRTKLPNALIHAPQELKIEARYLTPEATRLMENHAEFDSFVQQASGQDWSSKASLLNTILGGGNFYSKAFTAQSSTTWFGTVQRGFFVLINTFVSEQTGKDYINMAIEEDKSILRGETSALDASGEAALAAADADTQIWLYLGTLIVAIAIFWISFKKRWIGWRR